MLPDYHIHTPLCKHAEGALAEYLERARQLSLPEICVTDHAPNPDGYDPAHRMSEAEFRDYLAMIRNASRPGLPLLLTGIEADYYPGCERFLEKWLARNSFDLVIGSIHYLDNWGFDNPDEREVWDNVDVTNTWREYFKLLGRLADTRLFDTIGHFDLPKKFKYCPPPEAIREMVAPALDKVARADMAIELNTSGLRKPVREIYPSGLILEMARSRSIPICFGSDAHQPGEVGYEFAAALSLARASGYTKAVRFSRRRKTIYDLPA